MAVQVNQLAQSVETKLSHKDDLESTEQPTAPDDLSWVTDEHLQMMAMVFDYMQNTYGYLWVNQLPDAEAIEEAKLHWLTTMGNVHPKAIYKARFKLPDAFGSGDRMPGPLEFRDLVHVQYDSAFKIPSFERVAQKLSNPYWVPGDSGEDVLSTGCMIYWGILQEANKDVPVSVMRSKPERVYEKLLRKVYKHVKERIIYGVKYLPPEHIRELAEKKLLTQQMSKAESDEAIQKNNLETGNRVLAELKEKFTHKGEVA